jgi:hypothetical protein
VGFDCQFFGFLVVQNNFHLGTNETCSTMVVVVFVHSIRTYEKKRVIIMSHFKNMSTKLLPTNTYESYSLSMVYSQAYLCWSSTATICQHMHSITTILDFVPLCVVKIRPKNYIKIKWSKFCHLKNVG